VTFKVKNYRAEGDARYTTMTLQAGEFIRRLLIHVLPTGFHRIRHYGFLASGAKAGNLAKARELLASPEPAVAAEATSVALRTCPCCGGPMHVIEIFEAGRDIKLRRGPSPLGSTHHDQTAWMQHGHFACRWPNGWHWTSALCAHNRALDNAATGLTGNSHTTCPPADQAPIAADMSASGTIPTVTHPEPSGQIPIALAARSRRTSRGFLVREFFCQAPILRTSFGSSSLFLCSAWKPVSSFSNCRTECKSILRLQSSLFAFECFPLFDRAAGFPSPRPWLAEAGARRACQDRPSHRPLVTRDVARPHLDATEHDGTLVRSGPDSFFFHASRVSIGSAGYIVLFAVEGNLAAPWSAKASAPQCPERDHGMSQKESRGHRDPSRQGRRSLR
jgi:Putative transposase